MEIVCPRCNKDDRIIKVSSAFTSGIRTETRSGPAIGVGLIDGKIGIGLGGSGSSGFSVSEMSKRLQPPAIPKKTSWLVIVLVCLVLSGALFVIMGDLDSCILPNIIPLGIGIFWFISSKKSFENKMNTYNRLKSQWDKMYFCDRDDIVFIPGEGFVKTPDNLQNYFASSAK